MTACVIAALIAWLTWFNAASAGPAVQVVVGPSPPKLVRFAAEEMAGQLKGLFAADVSITTEPAADAEHVILLGNPDTNPTIAATIGAFWPKLSDQGHLIRTVRWLDQRPLLVVGGGSDTATLWAAYELGYRFGIRYLLSGDALPAKPAEFTLDNFNIFLEPVIVTRGWEVLDLSAEGFGGWGLEDHRRLIGQLAKLKYNRLHLKAPASVNAPFLRYDFGGVEDEQLDLQVTPRFQIAADTAGRRAFQGAKEYINPAFQGKQTNAELLDAGIALAQGVIAAGQERGFEVFVEMSPLSFPKVFKSVLAKDRKFLSIDFTESDDGVVIQQARKSPSEKQSASLVSAAIENCLRTYPALDGIIFKAQERDRNFWKQMFLEHRSFRIDDAQTSVGPFALHDLNSLA